MSLLGLFFRNLYDKQGVFVNGYKNNCIIRFVPKEFSVFFLDVQAEAKGIFARCFPYFTCIDFNCWLTMQI